MNENILFIDCETIPSQQEGLCDHILNELTPPGTMTKAETIEKWREEKAPQAAIKKYLDTALDGTYGELISLAWAFNQRPVEGIARSLEEPETKILKTFFDVLGKANTEYLVWCGHNIVEFDLPFLWKRSVINNCRPPIEIPSRRGPDVIDTMKLWAGYREYIKFDVLCRTLGLSGKTDMDGSMVWTKIQMGEYEEVLAYNKSDVEQVRACYRRMKFLDWIPENDDNAELTKKIREEDEKLRKAGFFDMEIKEKIKEVIK